MVQFCIDSKIVPRGRNPFAVWLMTLSSNKVTPSEMQGKRLKLCCLGLFVCLFYTIKGRYCILYIFCGSVLAVLPHCTLFMTLLKLFGVVGQERNLRESVTGFYLLVMIPCFLAGRAKSRVGPWFFFYLRSKMHFCL